VYVLVLLRPGPRAAEAEDHQGTDAPFIDSLWQLVGVDTDAIDPSLRVGPGMASA
jgi:hypothetical protein